MPLKNEGSSINAAFVASKKVGSAVLRNKSKRRLRAVFHQYENKIKKGSYIFVAKDKIHELGFKELKKDLNFALKRMELL